MEALGWWLMLVGSLRLASVWFGFFDIWALRLAVFSNTTSMLPLRSLFFGCLILYLNYYFLYYNVSEVHGRTFGVWTLLTCTLCFLCAFNLENKPLYLVTFLSFIYAFGHFLTEFLFYQTMALSNLTTVGIFAVPMFACNKFVFLHLKIRDINYMDAITVEFTSTDTCQAYLKMNSFGFSLFNLISGMGIYQYPFYILDEY
ncbi:hypothetical protein Gotri_010500 [Gossypium trilobum]|uniref:Ergosterol biosynthetic protein 28 n=1 Tax=Gossypium trilobum TaxID=34281 RepID=A0A7J9ER77_9ROSI|nr:hypothetical protein [Gossypium trilobum]